MYCTNCGTQLAQEARFCVSCGSPTNSDAAAAPQATPVARAQQGFAQLRQKKWFVPVAAVVGVLLFVGIGSLFTGGGLGGPSLKTAVSSCGIEGDSGVTLASDDSSVFLDGNGEDDFLGVDYSDTKCVLEALKAPETIYSRMASTNSLMGEQTMTWSNFKATWTYHPDNGLDLGIERQ